MSLLLLHCSVSPPYPLPVFGFHLCVYRLVAKPCAHILQIQAGASRQAQPNVILERVYMSKTVHNACVNPLFVMKQCLLHHSHNYMFSKYHMHCGLLFCFVFDM